MKAVLKFRLLSAGIAPLCGALAASPAEAAPLKVLCSNGLRSVMQALVPESERATRHAVLVDFAPSATQGASAGPFEAILDRLGLTAAVKPKLRRRDTGAQVGDAVAAVATRAREPQAAGDLIRFLLAPANLPMLESKGMQR